MPVPLEDAMKNMAAIDAIFRSAESGRWENIKQVPATRFAEASQSYGREFSSGRPEQFPDTVRVRQVFPLHFARRVRLPILISLTVKRRRTRGALTTPIRHDWTRDEIRATLPPSLARADFSSAARAPRIPSPRRSAAVPPAFDQDRRMPGGLRLLFAERALQNRTWLARS